MKFTGAIVLGFVGLLLLALPNLTRKELLFGCRVDEAFPRSGVARRSLREFRLFNGLIFAVVIGVFLGLPPAFTNITYTACPLVMVFSTLIFFLWEHRRISAFALQDAVAREAGLSAEEDRWPWFFWIGFLPLLILGGSAAWLKVHWNEIPLRFATHWDFNGQPNGWSARNVSGVYGPILVGFGVCLLLLGLSIITWLGARRSHIRRATVASLIMTDAILGALLSLEALRQWIPLPMWVMGVAPFFLVVMILFALVRAGGIPDGSHTVMREGAWKAGLLYFDPDDPALFVEKRFGLGYTLNFGNRYSWLVVGGLAAFVIGIVVLSTHR